MFEQDKNTLRWFGLALSILSGIAMLAFVYACCVGISYLHMRFGGK